MRLSLSDTFSSTSDLNRLIAAAVINRPFCELLLTDPTVALKRGYNGEFFSLSPAEYAVVVSVRACSLADFAQQVTEELRKEG